MAFFQGENLWINQLADGVAELVLDVPGGKSNSLFRAVLEELDKSLDVLEKEAKFKLLLVRTGKAYGFAAGPDANALAEMTPEQIAQLAGQAQRVFDKLENLRLPSVAVVAGACLGGGLELALACDYRVAIEKSATVFGFPELEIGLIPAWGATVRLPRLVGLERALQMLLGGRRLHPRDALAWGLADEVAADNDAAPPSFIANPTKRAAAEYSRRTWRQKIFESTRLGRWFILRGARRLLEKRLPDDMPAPWEALEAVRTGLRDGAAAGHAMARAAVCRLAQSDAGRNLLQLHQYRDHFRLHAAQPEGRIRRVGVLGAAGQGAALVTLAVTKGCQVVLKESDESALGYALLRLVASFQNEVARGAMSEVEMSRCLNQIRGTTAWRGYEDLELVLDPRDQTSASTFSTIEDHVPAHALLASTSAFHTVAALQEGVKRPERVAALHFLHPVGRSVVVELAGSGATRDETLSRLSDFVIALGRFPQRVGDGPGFFVYRFLAPYFNEAVLLVKEGMKPERVDEAMSRFGMLHGPLEHLDVLGWDFAQNLVRAVEPALGHRIPLDDTFALMVEKKWLGQKTGLGAYRHGRRRLKVHARWVSYLRLHSHVEAPHQMDAISVADQLRLASDRLVWLMVNEAAWCLHEGVMSQAGQLDKALALAGWAPHRGGPIQYAKQYGLENVKQKLLDLAARYGPRYKPCPLLDRVVV
ncbi:MAG: enoyl-CoA hydratase-related protein [Gemmataceae bacterium]|nr:enoyl-CoA hydratase-related protein [Gemmataceae bacterium]MCI0742222.1 enoyl-CoA hydratase-related protein [Gemmataceae bacterium]